MKNTLYIIDDHGIMRFGLKEWLEKNSSWKVIDSFANSADCLNALAALGKKSPNLPEIIIIDVQLVGETGFELCKEITKNYKDIKCIMYSMYNTSGYILQAMESGAKGYTSKISSEQELLKCLKAVQEGQTYLEEEKKDVQIKLVDVIQGFTKQERTIFEALLQGKSNEQISDELFISPRTVNNYISRIYDKVNVKNRTELLETYGK
ncbi:response regulator transcription factor [Treponema sp.]|uniref:response regulator transcription factor n=1 Tax=Treponema sp. TaxID=166 RepID=UPI00298E11FD|nr:response regulator transcription factor [Treponema sp.]MCQ2241701.1 response regulator transcription factor [Treponema sp.]